ncbi:G/T mismatches repair enzyme [uncultured archaeon]|nr:G/T mismatches repair enzyme [uncultured archaeon]
MKKDFKIITRKLAKTYDLREMDFPPLIRDPLDSLVGVILSQNSTDKVTIPIFRFLKSSYSYEELSRLNPSVLEKIIRPCGLAPSKSKRIIKILRKLKQENEKVSLDFLKDYSKEDAFNYLTSLEGIGPKSAAVILSFGFGQPFFPVDTHIYRVLKRIGFAKEKESRIKVQENCEKLIPDSLKHDLHLLLIMHGRKTCKPSNPRCGSCPIFNECNWKFKKKFLTT